MIAVLLYLLIQSPEEAPQIVIPYRQIVIPRLDDVMPLPYSLPSPQQSVEANVLIQI